MSLALAACGGTPGATAPPTAAATTVRPTAASVAQGGSSKPAVVHTGQNESLGEFITDDQGRTVYVFLKDTPNTSTCYDSCAQTWPPLLTQGQPRGMEGIDAALLSSTQRTDGTTQVTFNGFPLYYHAPDQQPGDTNGQGRGDVWYVIAPAGEVIKTAGG
jgi:predicted lipoprotein with Yx(FWY)xxD motif